MHSLRLKKIVTLLPERVGVADIGTDHAQIPIYLAQHTECYPIIAGEKNSGPYKTALHWISQYGLEDEINLRLGSGLTILKPGEVQWAIIAGMGYKTIIEIIEEAETIARSLDGLILQPMQGPEEVRRWLIANSFKIVDEILVKEDDKLFQVIKIQPGQSEEIEEIMYLVGPVLFEKGDPLLTEHLDSLIAYHQEVLEKIPDPQLAESRVIQLQSTISKLKEVSQQWQRRSQQS